MQLKVTRSHRDTEEYENALHERNRTRILEHDVDAIEQKSHNQDIDNVEQRNGRQDAAKLCRHRKIKWHKNPHGNDSLTSFPSYIPAA